MSYVNKILLGTAQLGLHYGINNVQGKPNQEQASEILDVAFKKGIQSLDTAEAYGNAIDIIGVYHKISKKKFNIISKLSLNEKWENTEEFEHYFSTNLTRLDITFLEGYLFHDFNNYQLFEYWDVLEKLKSEKKIKNIGVSIYSNEQAKIVAEDKRIAIVQLPFNILDNNNQRREVLELLKKKNKEVHVRSVFLQGLFFRDKGKFTENLKPILPYIENLKRLALKYRTSISLMAMAYNLKNPLIDKVLIGVDDVAHLKENIMLLSAIDTLDIDLFSEIDAIDVKEITLLNPTNW